MPHVSKHLIDRLRRWVTLRSVAAMIPNWLLAIGFMVLLSIELSGARALPGQRVFYVWFLLEALGVWVLPMLYLALRLWGRQAVAVLAWNVLPTITAVLLASGYLSESVKFLIPGYALVFVYNKCLAFFFSSSSHDLREAFMIRVIVGSATWVISIVLAGLILVFIFMPLRLQETRIIPCMLILSGCIYYVILGMLEFAIASEDRPGHTTTSITSNSQSLTRLQ